MCVQAMHIGLYNLYIVHYSILMHNTCYSKYMLGMSTFVQKEKELCD